MHGKDHLFELGGGFVESSHVSKTACTTKTKKTVVFTSDGPVEKTEEVREGGPECQSMDLSAFFPSLGDQSASTTHTGASKGSIYGDASIVLEDPFGSDLGIFKSRNVEDDHPDIQARSVKSATVRRAADYVGEGTKSSDSE